VTTEGILCLLCNLGRQFDIRSRIRV
jgi:hypothetical protein